MESVEIPDVFNGELTLFVSRTEGKDMHGELLMIHWPDAEETMFASKPEIKKLKAFLEAYLRGEMTEEVPNDGSA